VLVFCEWWWCVRLHCAGNSSCQLMVGPVATIATCTGPVQPAGPTSISGPEYWTKSDMCAGRHGTSLTLVRVTFNRGSPQNRFGNDMCRVGVWVSWDVVIRMYRRFEIKLKGCKHSPYASTGAGSSCFFVQQLHVLLPGLFLQHCLACMFCFQVSSYSTVLLAVAKTRAPAPMRHQLEDKRP
jgi:hypothetical protein